MSHPLRVLSLLLLILVGCDKSPSALEKSTPVALPPAASPPIDAGAGAAATADPWLPTQDTPKQPMPHPLFWSIEKDGKTTFVLGTMHLGVDAEKRLPDFVWKKLDAAPALAVEADLNDSSVGDMARTDGGSLHQDLGDAYWHKLEAAVTPTMAKNIDKMKPMVATTFLSMKGLDGTPAMDGVLIGRAMREKKDLIYLEAAGKQLVLLEKWMTVKALKMMLDHLPDTQQATKDLLKAYLAGDDTKIVQLGEDERKAAKESGFTDAEFDEQMKDLLFDRNASWIDKIEAVHARNNAFIAVGAMHLLGPKSVLALLAAKGYKVTRLAPPN
ncbi:MAG: TraB/GumN family protein [Proteobacteria bacterium]|nr:TraB/GumN family protein [Pseudomonadota bacterium]